MVAKVIMTDSIRNKVVGVFSNKTEAQKNAKEEDIKVVSFEICKGGEMHERKEVDSSRT